MNLTSLLIWAAVDCLAHSHLTAISRFVFRNFVSSKQKRSSLSSFAPNHKRVVLALLQPIKKTGIKPVSFNLGRSGLEPPTSPLSGVRSNHLS